VKKRCEWVQGKKENYLNYHDSEWGIPVHDDRLHFEMLILEGAQAGLSWETVLNKRERYRLVYDNFDPYSVASYNNEKIEQLMTDSGIIRNRRKIEASIKNAKVFTEIQSEFGSFDAYIWGYVSYQPIINAFHSISQVPAKTKIAEIISKDLKKRGMNFVGPTIIYAYMQAVGIVNDHTRDCFRYGQK